MVATVKRTIRIKTQQHILPEVPPVENFPVRQWSIEIVLLDDEGKEIPFTILTKLFTTCTQLSPILTGHLLTHHLELRNKCIYREGSVDLEKLAFGLTKLNEDDLVGVVQMVTDNKTPEMNVTNNVEEGEFIIDLYSLPEGLLKSLWDYVKKNTE
ncbi:CRB_1a_G0054700.mRNA.1.CDS.1 [Saccharomyces cerevisiae]|nr:CRB_1a_G0054700.mRNA.1.CDS.1 [Saccharomyces cerevisiae]CAI7479686.1 CRB_1a_G0054700.mRNA.1.CDS.1 [Saccharomyces cerevisiae]